MFNVLSNQLNSTPTHMLIPKTKGGLSGFIVTGIGVESFASTVERVWNDLGVKPPPVVDGNNFVTKDIETAKASGLTHVSINEDNEVHGDNQDESGVDPITEEDEELIRGVERKLDGFDDGVGSDLNEEANRTHLIRDDIDEAMYAEVEPNSVYTSLESYARKLKGDLTKRINETKTRNHVLKPAKDMGQVIIGTKPIRVDLTYHNPKVSLETMKHGNPLNVVPVIMRGETAYGTDGVNEFHFTTSPNQDKVNERLAPTLDSDGNIGDDVNNPEHIHAQELAGIQLSTIPIIMDPSGYGEIPSLGVDEDIEVVSSNEDNDDSVNCGCESNEHTCGKETEFNFHNAFEHIYRSVNKGSLESNESHSEFIMVPYTRIINKGV